MLIENNNIYNGDCLEVMEDIPDKSVDMILCDLPYGTTQCKWDTVIPFNKYIEVENKRHKKQIMYENDYILNKLKTTNKSYNYIRDEFNEKCKDGLWEHYERIIKDNGAIILFAQTPFDKVLGCSNLKMLKYEWIWEKTQATGYLNAKKMPMKAHENILVFYKKPPVYNPQKTYGHAPIHSYTKYVSTQNNTEIYGKMNKEISGGGETERYPRSVLLFPSDKQRIYLHPTQKPLSLCEYLVKTYSNEKDVVLDNCMGSGTTGVACKNLHRKFIGIELDEKYFEIAKNRINSI